MSFTFLPVGSPLTSSFSINALVAATTSLGGRPVTAALAEFVSGYIGPTGATYRTISSSTVVPPQGV